MTEWLAWVEILDDVTDDGTRVRRYVTHGIPFLQLTPFRSAGARYGSREVAHTVASFAAGGASPYGAEVAPAMLAAPAPPRAAAASDPRPALPEQSQRGLDDEPGLLARRLSVARREEIRRRQRPGPRRAV